MKIERSLIDGVNIVEVGCHEDPRGKLSTFEIHDLNFNKFRFVESTSNLHVLRGIHLAPMIENQIKIIRCTSGKVLDLQIDFRLKSPTFLKHQFLTLHSLQNKYLRIEPGIGHAFLALEKNTVMQYLINNLFNLDHEIAINPLLDVLEIPWPRNIEFQISPKDLLNSNLDLTIKRINQ